MSAAAVSARGARVADLCAELIRFDTSPDGPGERDAAESVAARLEVMGLPAQLFESRPARTSVVARLAGTDPGAPALLIQTHLDVVAADRGAWSVDPFAGEIRDGYVWGRGAVDMKNMIAMCLTVLADKLASGWRPARDIVFAALADEERGGADGAGWLVEHHPDLFAGCTESVGEAGGFSADVEGQRVYFVQTAEKGIRWLRLRAHGQGGHGSLIHECNAIGCLGEALVRIQGYAPAPRPVESTRAVVELAQRLSGNADPATALAVFGPLARLLAPALRNTYSLTTLTAGGAHNVVPDVAEAGVDSRFVPGAGDDIVAEARALVGDLVDVDVVLSGNALETPFDGAVPEAIYAAVAECEPGALLVPVCLPIGTDGKHFAKLGIRNYGFVPLPLPPGYDFGAMFHGVDERVPVESLGAGAELLHAFLGRC